MRVLALTGAAAVTVSALLAAPSGAGDRDVPAGRLVLGLHPPERIAVVDVRSGHTVVRRVPGGTLCHGPLVVSGGRVVLSRAAGHRPGVDSLDLGLGHRRRLGTATRLSRLGDPWAHLAGHDEIRTPSQPGVHPGGERRGPDDASSPGTGLPP